MDRGTTYSESESLSITDVFYNRKAEGYGSKRTISVSCRLGGSKRTISVSGKLGLLDPPHALQN